VKIENHNTFIRIWFFFQSMVIDKSYAAINSKWTKLGSKTKFTISLNFFSLIDYNFVYIESFDSLYLDQWCESYGASCFVGSYKNFLKKQCTRFVLNSIFTIFRKRELQKVKYAF